jgi:pyrimidine operon attenuation protein/uracil phosphoribosyltransferase
MPRIPEPPLPASQKPKNLLDEKQLRRVVRRIAGEIVEHGGGTADLMLVGIRTRGVPFAERLAAEIAAMEGSEVAFGVLDITLYRDDLSTIAPQPVVKETVFPVPIDDRVVVLCDDVLYTGRTIRAALDALVDYGRPRAVRLAVVIDRGHRELPIQAEFVGKSVQTEDEEVVEVRFEETDGHDGVHLMRRDQIELANRTGGSDGAGEDA